MAEQQEKGQQATVEEGSLLDQMLEDAKVRPSDESYGTTALGLKQLLREMLAPDKKGGRVDKKAVDRMIAEIDQQLSKQVNEVLHHPKVQKLESSWRGLKYLVDNTDFRENNKVEFLNVSKDDLAADFEDTPEIPKSGLYQKVYAREYGVFGGSPVGMIVGNYDFDHNQGDIELLRNIAAVSAMSHAPFIGNAAPKFFGCDSWLEVPKLRDLQAIFDSPKYAAWNSFRESEDSRYVGLTGPRFLLRRIYGKDNIKVKEFDFEEEVIGEHESYLWGGSAFAMATRVADSFAQYRWCPNIIGPNSGGAVENLPLHQYESMGELQTKIPTEVQLTLRREFEMSEQGFIGLTYKKDSDNAAFFSANSCQKPKNFPDTPEGKKAETNYRLGTMLPYVFIISRLAHYLKVLQTEHIGSWKERADLERELNKWISQYVTEMDNPAPAIRARKPLREARVIVENVDGQPGWYKCKLEVRPFFKYMGADFTLSLVGKLDKD
ncbi:MAG: type VI secretion system contractile sheath large subunit [Myxococcota bacterium]